MEKTIRVNGADFVLVPVSTLSLTDNFMKYLPKSNLEKSFKELLTKVIKSGVSDFYRPKIDPSFDKHGKICYQAGSKPAEGKSYNWWEREAKEFCPERSSRIGTKSEYVAFLGVLIKKLVEEGMSVEWAWYAVCSNSVNLGHYWNSKGALRKFEPTGSREICGYFDLANTYKILAGDKEDSGFWLASGNCHYFGHYYPLVDLCHNVDRSIEVYCSVGWLVLEK